MAVVIDFCREPSEGLPPLRGGDWEAWFPFWDLPEDTSQGDVGVLYAGMPVSAFLGTEEIASGWRRVSSGEHRGEWYVMNANQRLFTRPIPAGEVEQALGMRRPRGPLRLPEPDGTDLLRFLRRRRGADVIESAVEGILTESRRTNRSRNRKLRDAKLAQAKGRCEACGVYYSKLLDPDGRRVLMVHHRKQISAFSEPRENSLDDLAVLCANCHMLVHSDVHRAMPVEELARKLSSASESRAQRRDG